MNVGSAAAGLSVRCDAMPAATPARPIKNLRRSYKGFSARSAVALKTRRSDDLANHAVALAVEIQHAGRVDREAHVGAASEAHVRPSRYPGVLPAALVVR